MLVISKLFTVLLLPPGCFILGLLGIMVWIPRSPKFALLVLMLLLYLASIEPVKDRLIRPLEDAYPPLPVLNTQIQPEALVLLGGGTVQGSPETGQDTLGTDALKRAVYAFSLGERFPLPYILSGGKVFDYGQETEAAVTARLLTSLGMAQDRLILETESRNTWENAQKTAALGYKQVILITSAYHIPRSVLCFERNGIQVIPGPTDYKSGRGRKYDFFSFMPTMGALNDSYIALHEYVGLLYYRVLHPKLRIPQPKAEFYPENAKKTDA